jgi:hypothetical protein
MKNKKRVENQTRGWLPKEPTSRILASHNNLLQFGSLLLPTVGIGLITVFCYTTLLIFFDIQTEPSTMWVLLLGYLVGVELVIIGAVINTRLKTESPPALRKPVFVVGLSFLYISVVGFIFDRFFAMLNMTYPFSVHSLLVKLLIFWRTGWLSMLFWCFGFVAWLLLLASGALSTQASEGGSSVKKRHSRGYFTLAIGAIITIVGVGLTFFSLLSPMTISSLWQALLFVFYAFLEPLGIICLTIAWATIAAAHSRNSPFLLPSLYAVLVAVIVVFFLIPI